MAVKTLKYAAVRDALLDQIESGQYEVGQMIPSERELMEIFGVSRITIRKALGALVQEGHLNRVQGKGTYVADAVAHDLISLTSFTEDMSSRGMTVSRAVLDCEVTEADAMIAENLNVSVGDPVLRFDRVFLADAQPVNRTLSYLPLDLFPGIEELDLARESLYEVIEGTYDIPVVHARRMLDAVLATEEDAQTLGVTVGEPLIRFQAFTYGDVMNPLGQLEERVIEAFTCRYRSNPHRFDISQVRMPRELRGKF